MLLTLPGNLLNEIFSLFCGNCAHDPGACPSLDDKETHEELAARQKVLASLCRTSKTLKTVAEPHLYHAFSTHDSFFQRHVLFIRSLYERPDLRSYLRRATFVMYSDETIMERAVDDLVDDLGPSTPRHPHWQKVKRCRNPESQVDYMQRKFRHQFLTDAVLSVAENLQHVAIEGLGNEEFGSGMPAPSRLPALRSLRLRNLLLGDATRVCEVADILPRAPNLRLLEVPGCESVPKDLDLRNLAVLSIPGPLPEQECLPELLKTCTNLQAFTLLSPLDGVEGRARPSRDNPDPSLGELTLMWLIDALQPCRESLRYLDVFWEESDLFARDTPAGLQSFSRLETLIFNMARICPDILGIDRERHIPLCAILPPSIRSVLLVACDPEHVRPVMSGLPEKIRAGQFSDLREIVIVLDTPTHEEQLSLYLDMREEMREAFQGTIVSFQVVIWQLEDEQVFFSDTEALFWEDFGLRVPECLTWSLPAWGTDGPYGGTPV